MADVRWVVLAEVTKPHGIRGEVRLKVYNRDSDLLSSQHEVRLSLPDGPGRDVEIEAIREVAGGALLVKLRDVDDRNAAETLRGARIAVRRDAFPLLEPGEFYVCDIVGADIVGPGGPLGTALDVVSYPTADALLVRPLGGAKETVEVPLLDTYVDEVSAERRLVVLKESALELFS
jgi:16S rRNA processing protein RimM